MALLPTTEELNRFVGTGVALSLKDFNKAVSAAVIGFEQKDIVTFQKKISIDVLTGVTLATPVNLGRARGNWILSVGSFSNTPVDINDVTGKSTISTGLGNLSKLRPFQVVFITNNVEYILVLEGGSSSQAPEGMVSMTLNSIRNVIQK